MKSFPFAVFLLSGLIPSMFFGQTSGLHESDNQGYSITVSAPKGARLLPGTQYIWRLWVSHLNDWDSAIMVSKKTMTREVQTIDFDVQVPAGKYYWVDIENLPHQQALLGFAIRGLMPARSINLMDSLVNTGLTEKQKRTAAPFMPIQLVADSMFWRKMRDESITVRLRTGVTPRIDEAEVVEMLELTPQNATTSFKTKIRRMNYYWIDVVGSKGWSCLGQNISGLSGLANLPAMRTIRLYPCTTLPDYSKPIVTKVADSLINWGTPTRMDIPEMGDANLATVRIGRQVWMKHNLAVSVYNDGRPINTGLSNKEWAETKNGAYAIYENKAGNNTLFGKLYNGYAVATGKLCPKGWRIPTDADWKELEQYLGMAEEELNRTGGRSELAEKLKEAGLWQSSRFPSNNNTGFSALPGGIRESNGDYIALYQYANFWSATPYENPYKFFLWNRHLYYNSNEIGRSYVEANKGMSCRCIKE